MELSTKWSIVIVIVVSVVVAVGLTLINRYFGSMQMLSAIVVLLAVSNIIIAVSLEKKIKKMQEEIDELKKQIQK